MADGKLTSTLALLLLLASTPTFANEDNKDNLNMKNFISQRPYEQAVTSSVQSIDSQWEGAALMSEETVAETNNKTMRLHMLGKRPFVEKITD